MSPEDEQIERSTKQLLSDCSITKFSVLILNGFVTIGALLAWWECPDLQAVFSVAFFSVVAFVFTAMIFNTMHNESKKLEKLMAARWLKECGATYKE